MINLGPVLAIMVLTLLGAIPAWLLAALADEDANHWFWLDDEGPTAFVRAVHVCGSLCAAALIASGVVIGLAGRDARWLIAVVGGLMLACGLQFWPTKKYYLRTERRHHGSDR